MKFTKEELFEKAKTLYPVGTMFKVAHQPYTIRTVKSHEQYKYTFVNGAVNLLIEEKSDCPGASVYCSEKGWAEIVFKPELEYEIY